MPTDVISWDGDTLIWGSTEAMWGVSGITLLWDGDEVTWDGEPLLWSLTGLPAPPCPATLYGLTAPRMLDYLAYYFHCATHVRNIIQPEGYEFDTLRSYLAALPHLPIPEKLANWSVPIWESSLRLQAPPSWTMAQRRRRVAASLGAVVTPAQVAEYIGAHALIDADDITVSVSTDYELTVAIDAELTPYQLTQATAAANRVIPAHLTLDLTSL